MMMLCALNILEIDQSVSVCLSLSGRFPVKTTLLEVPLSAPSTIPVALNSLAESNSVS